MIIPVIYFHPGFVIILKVLAMRLFRPNVEKMLDKKDVDGLVKALTDREADIRTAAASGLGAVRYSGR